MFYWGRVKNWLPDLGIEAAAILRQITRLKKCIGLHCSGARESMEDTET